MSEAIRAIALQVVAQFDEIVRPDGGSVSLIALEDGVLRVRYAPGRNEACATCVMEPDALAGMMKDVVGTLAPSIVDVRVDGTAATRER